MTHTVTIDEAHRERVRAWLVESLVPSIGGTVVAPMPPELLMVFCGVRAWPGNNPPPERATRMWGLLPREAHATLWDGSEVVVPLTVTAS